MSVAIIKNKDYSDSCLYSCSLGDQEYRQVDFSNSDMRKVKFEDACLLNCDLTNIKPLGSTFRFDCKQGFRNKLDPINTGMFLYWFINMFDLPTETENSIRSVIGPNFTKIKRLFDSRANT